ncbi:MAG: PGF-CTERM sorting domain-containing protein [Methanophagales archaeon ANME-1-THS]|nr:MAG: PGF-CTERM sorting domain-containing protein [Methanophagales archaeon ANME-1-THS]
MIRRTGVFAPIVIGVLILGMIGLGTALAAEQATTTEAVHFSKLISFLPDPPSGWRGEEPFGTMQTYEGGSWSTAARSYQKLGGEDLTAEVMITDYALYATGWLGAWNRFYAFESTEGYIKSVTIDGFPAWEVYTRDTNDYSLYVGINDRFLVFITTDSDKNMLDKLADSIDFKGIAALGKGAPAPTVTGKPTPTPAEETHTEPPAEEGKTPGFEAVFALAGLLVVLYLVRRDN